VQTPTALELNFSATNLPDPSKAFTVPAASPSNFLRAQIVNTAAYCNTGGQTMDHGRFQVWASAELQIGLVCCSLYLQLHGHF
jgi:hypothetical protein